MTAAVDLMPEGDDALARLAPAAADAVRATLAPGERIAYAGAPLSPHDAGDWTARIRGASVVVAFVASLLGAGGQVVLIATGETPVWKGLLDILLPAILFLGAGATLAKIRLDRRKAAASAVVVTDRRAILVSPPDWATSASQERRPGPTVLTIGPEDIDEIFRWTVSPKCGHVRFSGGIRSTHANALMFVPDAAACETAMRAVAAARPVR